MISGLPKAEIFTTTAIEKFFSRYGKIEMVLENPNEIAYHRCESSSSKEHTANDDSKHSSNEGIVFISFMSERSASLAIATLVKYFLKILL